MASYLGYYPSAAKNREKKIIRAIKSVIKQTYTDWELLIIGDSCEKTVEICKPFCDEKIKLMNLVYKRDKLFMPFPRNAGIKNATGDWICYLDIDDVLMPDHLANISKGMTDDVDWIWFDDNVWSGKIDNDVFNEGNWTLQPRALEFTMCGTCNIAHRRLNDIYWFGHGYKHDWNFILKLKNEHKNYKYVDGGKYMICHLPDKNGYDV